MICTFAEADAALLLMVGLLAISAMALLARRPVAPEDGPHACAASGSPAGHPPVVPVRLQACRVFRFVLGVPFFAVALAAPQTAFTREEVIYPGRRMAIAIDSSNSMVMTFKSEKLNTNSAAFFTAAAAAEYFMRLRMNGPYHDLIALLEFGNYAYVVTPFTDRL